MSRRRAVLIQADLARVIRAAKQTGAPEVELQVGGETKIIVRLASSTGRDAALEADDEIVL
jgi:hypothetical protein